MVCEKYSTYRRIMYLLQVARGVKGYKYSHAAYVIGYLDDVKDYY